LPTLPNSPSSAYEDEPLADADTIDEMGQERSHFSRTTVALSTTLPRRSPSTQVQSHFSEYSAVTDKMSPSSTYSSFSHDKTPLSVGGETDSLSYPTSPCQLPSMPGTPALSDRHDGPGLPKNSKGAVSHSSSCQSSFPPSPRIDDLDSSGLCITTDARPSQLGKGAVDCYRGFGGFQAYKLPEDEHASELTLRKAGISNDVPESRPVVKMHEEGWPDGQATGTPHPTTMQQLIDELSYLGGMIQS